MKSPNEQGYSLSLDKDTKDLLNSLSDESYIKEKLAYLQGEQSHIKKAQDSINDQISSIRLDLTTATHNWGESLAHARKSDLKINDLKLSKEITTLNLEIQTTIGKGFKDSSEKINNEMLSIKELINQIRSESNEIVNNRIVKFLTWSSATLLAICLGLVVYTYTNAKKEIYANYPPEINARTTN